MKVHELMKKVHLYPPQKTIVHDRGIQQNFVTVDRYAFGLDSDEVERLLGLKVNSFSVSEKGIEIFAE